MGDTGYVYAYGDTGPTTTYCAGATEACIDGTTTPTNPPTYSYYGIGLGINLGPSMGATMPAPVQLGGTAVTVNLSTMPANGARVLVNVGGSDYCAVMSTNPATIDWSAFNTKCYDSPPDGTALTSAPATPHIAVQAVSGTAEETVAFCIDALSWQ